MPEQKIFIFFGLATAPAGCQLLFQKPVSSPPTPQAPLVELTIITTDAKTEKPVEGAWVVLKEIIACPAMEGYPCPQGLRWQTRTNKQGQALFVDQNLKEYVTKNLTKFG